MLNMEDIVVLSYYFAWDIAIIKIVLLVIWSDIYAHAKRRTNKMSHGYIYRIIFVDIYITGLCLSTSSYR